MNPANAELISPKQTFLINDMSTCLDIKSALSTFEECIDTDDGARVATHCLYPSFEQVRVYIGKLGDGFVVHDRGEASLSAWDHGRDSKGTKALFQAAALRFHCKLEDETITARAANLEWLPSAILAVANAAAEASNSAVKKITLHNEGRLVKRIGHVLNHAPWRPKFSSKTSIAGRSGRMYEFDYSVRSGERLALVDAIVPYHSSIASKYLAFSDTERGSGLEKYAIFDDELEQQDKSLMSDVATLVPFSELEKSHGEILFH